MRAPAKAILAISAAIGMATLALLALTWGDGRSFFEPELPDTRPVMTLADIALTLAFAAYPIAGGVILHRRPHNRVALILATSGLLLQLWVFSFRYALLGSLSPDPLPGTHFLAWMFQWVGVVGLGLAFTFLPLLFPTGRLVSPRWRPVAWLASAALVALALTWSTAPGPLVGFPDLVNPVGLDLVTRLDLTGAAWMLLVLAVIASAVSLFVRFHRAEGLERRQVRWFFFAAALMGLALIAATLGSELGWDPWGGLASTLVVLAFAGLPVAVFLALVRHDLYQLEVIVSRTIVYGALVALITVLYVATATAAGLAIGGASLLVPVLVTAVVAVGFQPLRARLQRLADRAVYGRRASPYDALSELSQRVGNALAADEVLPEMARIITSATGASRASVWLALDDQVRLVASHPPGRGDLVPFDGEVLPELPDSDHTVEVRHGGRLLGGLALTVSSGRTLEPTEHRLVGDLAAHAGLVMDNARLIEELKASRQRIVTAQDEERRRLERDIHDGLQQQLLTLALSLRTASTATRDGDDRRLASVLDAAHDQAMDSLGELRRLARGIHPAAVTEGGLFSALDSLAERSQLPVIISANCADTLPPPVAITAYYLVSEGVTNATKHARASQVTVGLEQEGLLLRVEVNDDGAGGAEPTGSGLTGLTDRVSAIGGRLEIESTRGRGTRLRAELPCE